MSMDKRTFLRALSVAGGLTVFGNPALSLAQGQSALGSLARRSGLRFGMATSSMDLARPELARLITDHSSITLSRNDMKWKRVERQRGKRDYARARVVADFAAEHALALRGHNFVWNMDVFLPDWLVDIGSQPARQARAEITKQMWHHGHRMAKAFPNVASWDVVNEAVNPRNGKLRNSVLTRLYGDRFIDIAFEVMQAKAPGAQLVYNEAVSWGRDDEWRNGTLRQLESALNRGVRIDALGIESHLGPTLGQSKDYRAWDRFLTEVGDMGVGVVLTELDCDDRNLGRISPVERDRLFGDEIRRYLDLTLAHRNVRQIIAWHAKDNDVAGYWARRKRPAWIPDGQRLVGGVFDAEMRPTSTYQAIEASLRSAPQR